MNKLFTAIRARFKAFTMRFSDRTGWWGWGSLGSTRFNYPGVVDPRTSSIVMAVGFWLQRAFPEAPLRVQQRTTGSDLEPVDNHPMTLLIRQPNPYYSGLLLWAATVLDWLLTGNAYWLKVRSSGGRVVQLWWVPSFLMEPHWPDNRTDVYVDYYAYTPDPATAALEIPPSEVVHFRYGMDPLNVRKGLSPLASLFREIFTDDEAANTTAALLRNGGVPGLVVAPTDKDAEFTGDAEEMKTELKQRFSGDHRGEPIVFTSPTQIVQFGYSPEQLNLRSLRRIPEERVTAILGVPAMVVGLGAGLDRSTFANYEEARQAAYESNIIPTQRLLAEEIRGQLLPDFGDIASLEVDFDLTKVRVLQADENALMARMDIGVKGGWVKPNEARAALGLDALEGAAGETLYIPISVTPTPVADIGAQQNGTTQPANGQVPPQLRDWDDPDAFKPYALFHIPITKAPSHFSPAVLHLRTGLSRAAAADIGRFLSEQQARVIDALRQATKDLTDDTFDEEAEAELLRLRLEPWYSRALEGVAGITREALAIDFSIDDPLTRAYLRQSGALITNITETTRAAVQTELAAGQANGESYQQLARRIEALPAFDRARAELVGRTELGSSTNRATLVSFGASGVVVGVEVTDGTDWDDECRHMNGRRFTLIEAARIPLLAHPRCTRAFSPVTNAAELRSANGNGHVKELAHL